MSSRAYWTTDKSVQKLLWVENVADTGVFITVRSKRRKLSPKLATYFPNFEKKTAQQPLKGMENWFQTCWVFQLWKITPPGITFKNLVWLLVTFVSSDTAQHWGCHRLPWYPKLAVDLPHTCLLPHRKILYQREPRSQSIRQQCAWRYKSSAITLKVPFSQLLGSILHDITWYNTSGCTHTSHYPCYVP